MNKIAVEKDVPFKNSWGGFKLPYKIKHASEMHTGCITNMINKARQGRCEYLEALLVKSADDPIPD